MTDEQKRDARLVHQILSGDEDAFAELNALYKHRICEFIAGKIGDWHYAEERVCKYSISVTISERSKT